MSLALRRYLFGGGSVGRFGGLLCLSGVYRSPPTDLCSLYPIWSSVEIQQQAQSYPEYLSMTAPLSHFPPLNSPV